MDRFCKKCGTKLEKGDKFCVNCGLKVDNDYYANSLDEENNAKVKKEEKNSSFNKVYSDIKKRFIDLDEKEFNSYGILDNITITYRRNPIQPKDLGPEQYDDIGTLDKTTNGKIHFGKYTGVKPVEISDDDKYEPSREKVVKDSLDLIRDNPVLNFKYKELLKDYNLSDFEGMEIRYRILEDIDIYDLTSKDIKKWLSYYIDLKTEASKRILQNKTAYGLYIFDSSQLKDMEKMFDCSQNKINKEAKECFLLRIREYNLRENYYNVICEKVLSKIEKQDLSSDEIDELINELLKANGIKDDKETILHYLTGYSKNKEYQFFDDVLNQANLKGITAEELEEICKKISEELEKDELKNNEVKDRLNDYLEKEYSKNLNQFFSMIRNGLSCEIKTKREKTIYRERNFGTLGGGTKEATIYGPASKYQGRIKFEEDPKANTTVAPEIVHYWDFEKCTVYFYEDYYTFFDNQIFYKDISDLRLDGDEIIVVNNEKWKRTFRTPTDRWISDEKTRLIYKCGFYNVLNERGRNIPKWFLNGGQPETIEDDIDLEESAQNNPINDDIEESDENKINDYENDLEESIGESNDDSISNENSHLESFMDKPYNKMDDDERKEFLEALKESRVFIPIIFSHPITFELFMENKIYNDKHPNDFHLIIMSTKDNEPFVPVFTSRNALMQFKKESLNMSMTTRDLVNYLNKWDFKAIGCNIATLIALGRLPIEIPIDEFLSLFGTEIKTEINDEFLNYDFKGSKFSISVDRKSHVIKSMKPIENAIGYELSISSDEKEYNEALLKVMDSLKKDSTSLNESLTLYKRTNTDIKGNIEDKIFKSDFPFNLTASEEFNKESKYLNIFLLKKGDRILDMRKEDNVNDWNVIMAPDCEFELIQELDDYTNVWICKNQEFYKSID